MTTQTTPDKLLTFTYHLTAHPGPPCTSLTLPSPPHTPHHPPHQRPSCYLCDSFSSIFFSVSSFLLSCSSFVLLCTPLYSSFYFSSYSSSFSIFISVFTFSSPLQKFLLTIFFLLLLLLLYLHYFFSSSSSSSSFSILHIPFDLFCTCLQLLPS